MDLRIIQNPSDCLFDILFQNDEFLRDLGLQTMVTISLFSNRRVRPEELDPLESDRGGFWGEAIDTETDFVFGSRLWLLDRAKITPELLIEAEEYVLEALQWMIDRGIVQSVGATAELFGDDGIKILVEIERPEEEKINFQFDYLWEGQFNGS